jgi:hypothetical protein
MIIISDLNDNYIQEITAAETPTIFGGKSDFFPDINIAIISVVQINALTNYTSNYADINIKF